MKDLIKEINRNLDYKHYLSALALTLTLPDICGKIAYPKMKYSGDRYKRWYNEHIYPYEKSPIDTGHNEWVPDGFAIYKLRCNLLHEGSLDIESEVRKAKGIQESRKYKFILTNNFDSINLSWDSIDSNEKPDVLVRISVVDLCKKICAVAENFYYENQPNKDIYNDIVIFNLD